MTKSEAKQATREALTILAVNGALRYGITHLGAVSGTANVTLYWLLLLACGAGFLLQPWSLPVIIVSSWATVVPPPYSNSIMVTFVATSLITLLVYRRQNRAGRLARIKRVVSGRQARIAGTATGLVLALVLVSEYKDFPVRQHGRPTFSTYRLSTYKSLSIFQSRAYRPAQSPSRHGDYSRPALWQDRVAPDKVDLLMREMMMKRIATPRTLPENFAHQPPYWWHPRLTPDTRVYGWTAGGHRRDYSTYAVYDPATQILHVRED